MRLRNIEEENRLGQVLVAELKLLDGRIPFAFFVMGSSLLIGLFGGSFGSGGGRLGGVHDRRRQPDNPPEKERASNNFFHTLSYHALRAI